MSFTDSDIAAMSGRELPPGATSSLTSFTNMLQPLSLASTSLGTISPLIGGISSLTSGLEKERQLKQAALQAERLAGIQGYEQLTSARETVGRAATLAAASGGGLGGSAMGVLNQIAERGMFAARASAFRGISEADSDNYQARVAHDDAINSAISAVVDSAAAAASGGATMAARGAALASKDPMALMYMG